MARHAKEARACASDPRAKVLCGAFARLARGPGIPLALISPCQPWKNTYASGVADGAGASFDVASQTVDGVHSLVWRLPGFPSLINVDHLRLAYGVATSVRSYPVDFATIVHQPTRRLYGSPFIWMPGHVVRSIKAKTNVPRHDDHPPQGAPNFPAISLARSTVSVCSVAVIFRSRDRDSVFCQSSKIPVW
jgi:hypothetical protein